MMNNEVITWTKGLPEKPGCIYARLMMAWWKPSLFMMGISMKMVDILGSQK